MNCGTINQFKGQCQNFTVNKGDSFVSVPIYFWSDAGKTTPIDITGNTYVANVTLYNNVRLTLTPTITAPNILTLSTGNISLQVQPYSWDLKQTTPEGKISTLIYGSFQVIEK